MTFKLQGEATSHIEYRLIYINVYQIDRDESWRRKKIVIATTKTKGSSFQVR